MSPDHTKYDENISGVVTLFSYKELIILLCLILFSFLGIVFCTHNDDSPVQNYIELNLG